MKFAKFSKAAFYSSLLTVGLITPNVYGQTGPSSLNFEGTLMDSSDNPINQDSTKLKFEIWDKNGTCLLYSEKFVVDLFSSQGAFSVKIGNGNERLNKLSSSTNLDPKVFANPGSVPAFDGCANGVNLAAGDGRALRVYYDIGQGYIRLTPDYQLSSTPYAMVADTLQGRTASDFIRVKSDANNRLNQDTLETFFNSNNLDKMIVTMSGSSSQYLSSNPSAPINFNGQPLRNIASPGTASDAATKGYADSNIAGRPVDLSGIGPGFGGGRSLQWDPVQSKWIAAPSNIFMGGVGIGTMSPQSILDVNGSGSASAMLIPRDSTGNRPNGINGMIRYNTSLGKVEAYANGMWVNLSPEGNGSSSFAGVFYLPSQTTAPGTAAMALYNNNGTLMWNGQALNGTTNSSWVSTGSTTYLLNGNGRVGIGTSSPLAGLDIASKGSASALIVPRDTTANRPMGINGMIRYNTDTNKMEAYANGAWYNLSPESGGTSGFNGTMYLPPLTSAPGTTSMVLYNSNGTLMWNGQPLTASAGSTSLNGTPGFLPVFSSTNSLTSSSIMQVGGNVGIGTMSPMARLDVGGSVVFRGPASAVPVDGELYFDSSMRAYRYWDGLAMAWKLLSTQSAGTAPAAGVTSPWMMMGANTYITTGNVGIGTSMPSAGLDVSAFGPNSALIVPRDSTGNRPVMPVNGMIRYNTTLSKMEAFTNGGWASLITEGPGTAGYTGGAVATWTTNSSGSSVYLPEGPSVGIGTNSPYAKLHVQSPVTTILSFGTQPSGWGGFEAKNDMGRSFTINMWGSGVTSPKFGQMASGMATIEANSGAPLAIGTVTTAPVILGANNMESMRLEPMGHVGIGSNSPMTLLHLKGRSMNTGLAQLILQDPGGYFATSNSLNNYILGLDQSSNDTWSVGIVPNANNNVSLRTSKFSSTQALELWTAGMPRMTVTGAGNVGIGTASPMAALDVQGPVKLGDTGKPFLSMGACTVSAQTYGSASSPYTVTCPGVPAATNLAVSCSLGGGSTVSTVTPILVSARAMGMAGTLSVSFNTNVSASVPLHCMWIMPQ